MKRHVQSHTRSKFAKIGRPSSTSTTPAAPKTAKPRAKKTEKSQKAKSGSPDVKNLVAVDESGQVTILLNTILSRRERLYITAVELGSCLNYYVEFYTH
jgi:hypothetical protein